MSKYIQKVSTATVTTEEGEQIEIQRRGENVVLVLLGGHALTFKAEAFREIADEFAPKPRQPRGPNKRTIGAQNGQADESRVSA
jgi:hypothetical protein